MLFKNVLRSIMKRKLQFISLMVLVFLSVMLFVIFNTTSMVLKTSTDTYIKEHNVEDFTFVPLLDTDEGTLKAISEAYDFNYSKRIQKRIDFKVGSSDYILMAVAPGGTLATPYLQEGRLPENENEITLESAFAKANGVAIGEVYEVNGVTYTVVGNAYVSDYLYPVFNVSELVYNYQTQTVAYMTADGMNRVEGVEATFYLGLFDNGQMATDAVQKEMSENPFFSSLSFRDNLIQISGATLEIQATGKMAYVFIIFVLILSGFLLILITKKRMNLERKQIGILKAMGYTSNQIAQSYIAYGGIVGLLGAFLGAVAGVLAYPSMMAIYSQFYNIPFNNESPQIGILVAVVVLVTLALGLATYGFALSMSRKAPLKLLYEADNLKVKWFGKLVHKVTKPLSFKSKFKYNTASRSISRIMGVFFGVFSAGLLIMLFFVGSTMVNCLMDEGIKGANYNYETIYKTTIYEGQFPLNAGDEPFVVFNGEPISIKRQGKAVPIPSTISNSSASEKRVFGLPEYGKNLMLEDADGHALNDLLGSGIVITENLAITYGLEIGDELTFSVTDLAETTKKDVTLMIKGIYNNYLSQNIYYAKDRINSIMEEDVNAYNGLYSMDPVSSDQGPYILMSTGKTTDNDLSNYLSLANQMMGIVVFIAALIAFIVILVVSNLIVDENKKVISLLKVLGYNNKEISSMLMNVYTPIVVLAYLLSIVAGYYLFKLLIVYTAQTLGMAFPVVITPWQILTGLVLVLIIYRLALFFSKRHLNKISLSESLKEYE